MPGYVIGNYDIRNNEEYMRYPPAVGPTIQKYGGKMLVADREFNAVEGTPGAAMVVIEFESVEAAQRWYDSPENKEVMHLRTSTTEGWVLIASGFVPPGK